MPSAALYNLGCSKNIVDGERILHFVKLAGFTIIDTPSMADLIIVNTCAFIREAQEEAIETILSAAHIRKSGAKLLVSGCFSERFRAEVANQFPEVDIWAGVNDWEAVLEKLLETPSQHSFERELSLPYATQYLKIAEGCSHRCSFCVIPSIRGNYTSRTIESIISEARWLETKGVRELILVAQDSSFYGRESGSTLVMLLEKILASCSIPWIRIMYLHPQFVDKQLLTLMAKEKRICPYFDMPLQHIAEPILTSMKRFPLTKDIHRLIETIRTTVPDAAIRSSFICGYPGETESMFTELVSFIEWARFDKVGVFPFSPEKGTVAETLRPRPKNSTAQKRCETLMLAQREISREINEAKIAKNLDIIIDRTSEDPDFNFEGRSRCDAPEVDGKVFLRNGDFSPGDICNVSVIGASDYDLFAEIK